MQSNIQLELDISASFNVHFMHHSETWLEWRQELGMLVNKHIPRCYYPKSVTIAYKQLHGFSDASEVAYAGVVYFRLVDTCGAVHTSLVMEVAPD